ncbi:MAG: DUF1579 family protein [Vicinamibacterales bacterium]
MKRWVIGLIVAGAAVSSASAQPTRRAAEDSQLGFFLGKWNSDGQSRDSATGPFSKMTGTETCSWFSGGPSVICRETTKDANSESDAIYILSYDASKKTYAVYGTDNIGTVYSGTGTVDTAGVWRWTAESRRNGDVTPMRYTFKGGNGTRTMDVEISSKGTWSKLQSVTYKITR